MARGATFAKVLSASQRTQTGTGSSATIRRSLVVSQMALTVVLLVGAGLLGRSFLRLLEINPGYRTQHAVVLSASLPYERGAEAQQRRVAFYRELMSRFASIPGVTNVGAASGFPLVGGGQRRRIHHHDADRRAASDGRLCRCSSRIRRAAATRTLWWSTADYFDVMDIPVVRGRAFNAATRRMRRTSA